MEFVVDDRKHYPDQRVPIKSWCPRDYMGDALKQAMNLSYHPVIYKWVALMADVGYGYGMPIGCVIAALNAIIPNAVGKDIGCGVHFVRTSLTLEEVDWRTLEKIRRLIKILVPVGFNWHTDKLENKLVWPDKLGLVTKEQKNNIEYQLGTLGGGNHFIEIQADEKNQIGFMIHCGSRNFGSKVGTYYNKVAQKLNWIWHSKTEKSWDLAFLPIGSREAREYIQEMNFAIHFAYENRRLIAERVKKAFLNYYTCEFDYEYDVLHNYARIEKHFGKNVWVHRKGAISAKKDEIGIIPGNMGAESNSYVVKGKGNPNSFMSSSHGAGRIRSCTKSDEVLTYEECQKSMEGVLFDGFYLKEDGNFKLSEAQGAYKDINIVMDCQKDLVTPTMKLRPLAVIKHLKEETPWKK